MKKIIRFEFSLHFRWPFSYILSWPFTSLSFDLLQQLLLKGMVSLNHFSEEHFTDPITIHSMIKKFHKHSKVVDLTFQIFNGYIRISGSELTMRYFTYTFFWYICKSTA